MMAGFVNIQPNGVALVHGIARQRGFNPQQVEEFVGKRLWHELHGRGKGINEGVLDNLNLKNFHSKIAKVLQECSQSELGLPPEVTLAFVSMLISRFEDQRTMWQDCSKGQDPLLLVASNSSVVGIPHIFGNSAAHISSGRMQGFFGPSFNIREPAHLAGVNDFVPFSYSLGHNALPAAIIFFSAYLPTHENNGRDACSLGVDDHANLSLLRMTSYMDKARSAGHWIERKDKHDLHEFYYHVRDSKRTKIPIIPVVYDGETRKVHVVDAGKAGPRLIDYLHQKGMVGSDLRMVQIIANLEEHEKDKPYPDIIHHSLLVKHIGCVDLRVSPNTWTLSGLIKEIGSMTNDEQIRRMLNSPFSSAAIIGTHTQCGYVNTLIKLHMVEKHLRIALGDSKHRFGRMARRINELVASGQRGPYIEAPVLKEAIEKASIQGLLKRFSGSEISEISSLMIELGSGTTSDMRDTVLHGFERGALVMDKSGFLIMPAARSVEWSTSQLIPGEHLTSDHFAFLVNEAHARNLGEKFASISESESLASERARTHDNSEFNIALEVQDLKGRGRYSPPQKLPETKDELYDTRRKLFYSDPQAEPIMFAP